MRCVSLFSGCGGIDLGLTRAGFDVVFATDANARCAASHKANFPNTEFCLSRVEDLDADKLRQLRRSGISLLAGGPPCPPYSKSRFYRTDKPRGLDDPVGDATLAGYLRVLDQVRPQAFLFENVPGFRFKVHDAALRHLESQAARLGYTTNWEVLNAANFGVPQIRERFFMIGSLSGHVHMPRPTHAKPTPGALKIGADDWVNVGAVLADLDTDDTDVPSPIAGGGHHEFLRQVPPGDNYLFFTERRGHPNPRWEWRSRYWSFLLKLSPDLPSWTIQATRSNTMGPFHWRNRLLRIDEVRRLQGFPDDFELAGNVSDQWRQLGNAVPPPLAYALGKSIRKHLRTTQS